MHMYVHVQKMDLLLTFLVCFVKITKTLLRYVYTCITQYGITGLSSIIAIHKEILFTFSFNLSSNDIKVKNM